LMTLTTILQPLPKLFLLRLKLRQATDRQVTVHLACEVQDGFWLISNQGFWNSEPDFRCR